MKRLVVAAAVLAAAVPVPAGATPRPAPAAAYREWARQYRAHARGLPVAPLLDAAEAATSSGMPEFLAFVSAGDLDGDGAGDVADVRTRLAFDENGHTTATLRVEARRGRDGALLWARTVGDAAGYPYVFFAPVGAAGRSGMVAVTQAAEITDAYPVVAETGTATVAAFDGKGAPLWTHDASLAAAVVDQSETATDLAVAGVGDLVAGRATDLLLTLSNEVYASDPIGIRSAGARLVRMRVLDGATGTVRDLGAVLAVASEYGPSVVGDVSGDRLDDVAYVDTESADAALRVWRSSDGEEHSATALPPADYHLVEPAPDVTGDGRADVLVHSHTYDESERPSTMSLVDAAAARIAWTRPSAWVYYVGDADRRPGSEAVVYEPLYVPGGLGFRLTAVDGAGRTVWRVTRTLARTGAPDSRSLYVTRAGDVQGDGILDFRYAMAAAPNRGGARESGVVDGRTGRVRTGVPLGAAPADGALDGRGDDLYVRNERGGATVVTALRGDGPATLWETSVAGTGWSAGPLSARLDRDRCAELAISVGGPRATTYVLSGATGAPLWALTRSGDGPGVVTRPRALVTKRFTRTC